MERKKKDSISRQDLMRRMKKDFWRRTQGRRRFLKKKDEEKSLAGRRRTQFDEEGLIKKDDGKLLDKMISNLLPEQFYKKDQGQDWRRRKRRTICLKMKKELKKGPRNLYFEVMDAYLLEMKIEQW